MMIETHAGDSGPVVVAVDGSVHSKAAIKWAFTEAARLRCRVDVILVRKKPPLAAELPAEVIWPWPVVYHRDLDAVERAEKALHHFVINNVPDASEDSFSIFVTDGDPAELIVRHCETRDARLLIMGRRGLGAFKSLLLGSVSDKCASHANCPVLVVEAAPGEFDTIVTGVDGSPGSRRAALWAARQAFLFSASLHIVSTWDVPVFPDSSVADALELLTQGPDAYSLPASYAAEGAAEACRTAYPGLRVTSETIQGDPSEVLLSRAARPGTQMLVVGSRGLGGFQSLLVGSVSHQCLHHSPIAVAVVHG